MERPSSIRRDTGQDARLTGRLEACPTRVRLLLNRRRRKCEIARDHDGQFLGVDVAAQGRRHRVRAKGFYFLVQVGLVELHGAVELPKVRQHSGQRLIGGAADFARLQIALFGTRANSSGVTPSLSSRSNSSCTSFSSLPILSGLQMAVMESCGALVPRGGRKARTHAVRRGRPSGGCGRRDARKACHCQV